MWESLLVLESFPVYLLKSRWMTNFCLPAVCVWTRGKEGKMSMGMMGIPDTWE